MSIKNEFKSILKGAETKNLELAKKIKEICLSKTYTGEGKRKKVKELTEEMQRYIAAQQNQVVKMADEKIEQLEKEERANLDARYNNPTYQGTLKNTLGIIQYISGEGDQERNELTRRLLMFQDDPVAIAAIKGAIGKNRALFGCIPEDNRGKRQEQLAKLKNTMVNLLEEMIVRVAETAYVDTAGETIARDISRPAIISSTLDYIDACNDDCTIYDRNKTKVGGANTGMAFDFNFRRRH